MDTLLASKDKIIAISADDDTLRPATLESIPVDEAAIRKGARPLKASPEKCLVLGWNKNTITILKELDNYVPRGSKVLVVADPSVSDQTAGAADTLRRELGRMKNQKVDYRDGDTTDRSLLERIKAADFDHIIVLGYTGLEEQAADAKTLVTLLHLRDIAERDETPFSIVSEMLDLRNRELASVVRVDDFIISDHLISLMMAQLSEDADLHAVFADLFDPQGSEIYMKPAGDYIETGRPVNFYSVVEAARSLGQVAFGYRLAREAGEAQAAFGVHTNPLKSGQVIFRPEDKIIVLAED
jgi:hypothetical protein